MRARAVDLARTLLALGAIAPGLVAGVAVGLATRDRRRALNTAIGLWGRQGTRAAGIGLRVEGAEHLRRRPGVFLLNHRSGIDPILVCALLERDVVGVAKLEIRRNPVLGPAFAFAGTVFLDRGDRAAAIRALAPAVETLHAGLAVAIAPEGTRRAGAAIGPFKRGAFHLAMAAGVPVVPIVIHDADRVLPPRGWVMRGGPVHVTVHPPIPTLDWKPETLDRHVADLEALYRRSLARGPGYAAPEPRRA